MTRTWRESLAVYLEPRVLKILFLGFSSGMPLALVYWTLSAWLQEEGVTKTTIGVFSWAGSAYSFKFLWAPLIDRWSLPWLGNLLGRRRSWMLVSQLAVVGAILGLAQTQPGADLALTAIWSVVLAAASATQDIVIDAYRTESLTEEELGAGAANNTFGYRIAMLVSGAGALMIADAAGWAAAYSAMAACMMVGIATTLVIAEPAVGEQPATRSLRDTFYQSVWAPLAEFASRPQWLVILLFIAFYKYGDALLGVMANPFYLEIGFTKTEIALVTKAYGLAMTLIGVFLGGVLVARLGLLPALMVGGILQAATNLIYTAQAMVGHSIPMLACTISAENLAGGLATTAFVAYLSSLCNVAYTATQFALLSSIMALARTFFASGGGWLADHTSWPTFFVLTTVAALPGLALLAWMMRHFPSGGSRNQPAAVGEA
jgi:PAT family beta-lactamase induction signal transducer AmpG